MPPLILNIPPQGVLPKPNKSATQTSSSVVLQRAVSRDRSPHHAGAARERRDSGSHKHPPAAFARSKSPNSLVKDEEDEDFAARYRRMMAVSLCSLCRDTCSLMGINVSGGSRQQHVKHLKHVGHAGAKKRAADGSLLAQAAGQSSPKSSLGAKSTAAPSSVGGSSVGGGAASSGGGHSLKKQRDNLGRPIDRTSSAYAVTK